MRRASRSLQLAASALIAGLVAASAFAQDADELAQVIQRNIEDVAVQVRVAPAQAADELERNKEQLEELRRAAPNHPLLPSLERRVEELDDEIAAAVDSGPVGGGDDVVVLLNAPAEVRDQLRDVEQLQTRADREMMIGDREAAAEHLDEAESLIEAIEEEYGDRIPPGYARLIVIQERLAALRDQVNRPTAD